MKKINHFPKWILINQIMSLVFFSVNAIANELSGDSSTLDIQFIAGMDYSSGYYGKNKSTQMVYIPLIFKYRHQAWDFALTFSYLKISGPGGVVGGGDGAMIPVNTNHSMSTSEAGTSGSGAMSQGDNMSQTMSGNSSGVNKTIHNEGIGDILFKVNYSLDIPLQLPFWFEIGGQIKLPVADDEKELGTGKTDLSLYFEVADSFGHYSPFINVGYKFIGQPDNSNLNNIVFTSLGLDYNFSTHLNSGFIYDYKEKIAADGFEISETTLYLKWSVTKDFSVNSYVGKGFSTGSPDWTTGVQLSTLF